MTINFERCNFECLSSVDTQTENFEIGWSDFCLKVSKYEQVEHSMKRHGSDIFFGRVDMYNSNLFTELRLDHEPQEIGSRKPQKKIRIAAAATRGLGKTVFWSSKLAKFSRLRRAIHSF